MTKEEVYTQQLKEMGLYQPAFDPEIRTLAQMERELRRAQKAWKDAYDGETPKMATAKGPDPHYALICSMRKDILAHREALGLTPKGLAKLKGKDAAASPESEKSGISQAFERLFDKVSSYDATSPT